MKTPDKIYLIDMGDEIVWCDTPDPGNGMKPDDAAEYIKTAEVSPSNSSGLLCCPFCKVIPEYRDNQEFNGTKIYTVYHQAGQKVNEKNYCPLGGLEFGAEIWQNRAT